MPEPRCLNCGYVITGLAAAHCPACGRPFDLGDPTTFSTKPLFNRWRFWLPGMLLALACGAVLGPRWAWRWAEEIGIRTLHDYVLTGMSNKAAADAAHELPTPYPHPQVSSGASP